MSGYSKLNSYFQEQGIEGGFLEGMKHLKSLEQAGQGYRGEWAQVPVEVRGQYYEFMAAARAMFAPVEEDYSENRLQLMEGGL